MGTRTRSDLLRWSPWTITARGIRIRTNGVWESLHTYRRRSEKEAAPVRILVQPDDGDYRSSCDVFDDVQGAEALAVREARLRLWRTVAQMPRVLWIVVTRHPENIAAMVPATWMGRKVRCGACGGAGRPGCACGGTGERVLQPQWPRNLWVGCEVDTSNADARLPALLEVPAEVRVAQVVFSGNPAGSPVPDLRDYLPDTRLPCSAPRIGWVMVLARSDGTSGCDPKAVRDLAEQCRSRGVPLYLLQLGQIATLAARGGSKQDPDPFGSNPERWPEDLRALRQFPNRPREEVPGGDLAL